MNTKQKLLTLALVAGFAGGASGQLIITGVVDGTNTGGIPKGAELYATEDIADPSVYGIQRYTNSVSSASSLTQLSAISLNAGDFYYLTGGATSTTIFNNEGFTVGLTGAVVNINGDDLLQLVEFAAPTTVLDTFGQPNQGDTNFYENSIAYRNNDNITGNIAGNVDATPGFTITAYTNDTDFGNIFGSYSPVPEPSAYGALFGLVAIGFAVARRRRRS